MKLATYYNKQKFYYIINDDVRTITSYNIVTCFKMLNELRVVPFTLKFSEILKENNAQIIEFNHIDELIELVPEEFL